MAYPDYGTPGSPNMDPYYLSPKQEAKLEADHAEHVQERENFRDTLLNCIDDERGTLKAEEVLDILIAIVADFRLRP